MNSLVLRKAMLRGRAIEFSRLLMLSMLENAEDTFSVTLSLLDAELSRCNLNTDQFLQQLTELIDELRVKVGRRDENELDSASTSGLNADKSSLLGVEINACKICKKYVSGEERFYFNIGICPACYQQRSGLDDLQSDSPIFCKQCNKPISVSQKNAFKGNCSFCYYKTHQPETSSGNARQCKECLKLVPKKVTFYRTTQLCKNCYERKRILIRKANQKHCSECKKPANDLMEGEKCIPCYYEAIQMRQKNDNQFGWKDQEEMMMSLCPDVLNCRSCNKLASQSDLDDNGNCCECQIGTQQTTSIKFEDT